MFVLLGEGLEQVLDFSFACLLDREDGYHVVMGRGFECALLQILRKFTRECFEIDVLHEVLDTWLENK